MALSAGAKVPPLGHIHDARGAENTAPASQRSFLLKKPQNPAWNHPESGIISSACKRKGLRRGGGLFVVRRSLGSCYPTPFSPSSSPLFLASSSSSRITTATATPVVALSFDGRGRRAGGVAAPAPAAAAAAGDLLRRRECFVGSSSPGRIELCRPLRHPLLHGHNQSTGGQFDCRATKSTAHEGAVLDDVPHLSEWVHDLPRHDNPLQDNPAYKAVSQYFVEDDDIVAKNVVVKRSRPSADLYFRRAGPRQTVCFKSDEVRAAIVTCGGLCPGLNTVIREIVCGLWTSYGVRDIIGIEGGYAGFYSSNTISLNPKVCNDIHKRGGTILGTSRGGHDKTKIVAAIVDRGINQVYIIGGDGTQKGANVVYQELKKLGMKVVVAGIPKTIDNDIAVIDKSFGFDTAVEEAQRAINAAHVEAESVKNGVGLVKLMGRHSGYIAMYATLASRDVDLCLIPEVPFYLEGKGGLLEFVRKRLKESGHMVIVVAEGAGQELIAEERTQTKSSDASGNQMLADVGLWLCHHLREHFTAKESLTLKYIDPTYMVRAIPSNASDNVYCTLLAHSAMHGAMAGYTGFTVGPVNGRHAYIPISTAVETPNKVSVTDRMWARLLSSTNQPDFLQYQNALETKRAAKELSRKLSNSENMASTNGSVPQESKKVGLKSEQTGTPN